MPVGQLCVKGSVIDFEERPLYGPDPDEDYNDDTNSPDFNAWIITMEPGGITDVVDEDGLFEFGSEYFADPGEFTFTINAEGTIWTPVDPYEYSVEVNVDYSKDCQVIRFKLVTLVPVDVIKIDDAHKLLDDWKMVATPASGNWFWGAAPATEGTTGLVDPDADPPQDNPEGTVQLSLTPGAWIITEHAPSDTAYTPIMPTTGQPEPERRVQG